MSRNEDKAHLAFLETGVRRSRKEAPTPFNCESLPLAHAARNDCLKQISRLISKIQDDSIEETTIRSLNDDINKLIKDRADWDLCIAELGGSLAKRKDMKWGEEMLPEPGNVHGYLYFGRARELSGVREILQATKEQTKPSGKRQSAKVLQIRRLADPIYYGYLDEETEEALLQEERAAEDRLRAATEPLVDWSTGLPLLLPPDMPRIEELQESIKAPVVPTQAQMEQILLEKHKQALLQQYTTEQ